MGYYHQTVDYSENCINPDTGANTQTIESLWSELKTKMLRKMHNTATKYLSRHLMEIWNRSKISKNKDLFLHFLNYIKNCQHFLSICVILNFFFHIDAKYIIN